MKYIAILGLGVVGSGTADLFYADGSFICSFDSMEELKYFVMGVK